MHIKYLTIKQLKRANDLAKKSGGQYLDLDMVNSLPERKYPIFSEFKVDSGFTRVNIGVKVADDFHSLWFDLQDKILSAARTVTVRSRESAATN